jgi:hypothetical protein
MAVVTPFMDLPLRTRTEVGQLAKKGKGHPDPDVRVAAQVWATEEMHRQHTGWGVLAVVLDIVSGGGAMTGSEFSKFQLARRIAKLHT